MSLAGDELKRIRQTFGENLERFIERKGISKSDFAIEMGVTKGAVSQWCSGRSAPSADKAKEIADFFGVKVSDLTEKQTTPNASIPTQTQVPLFASVSAGFGSTQEDEIGTFPFSGNTQDVIAVLVSGDSMTPDIADGDTIIVKRQSSVDYGDIAVVRVDGEHFVKKVEYTPEYIRLISLNKEYKPIILSGKEMLRCSVEGKVIGSYKRW